MKEQPDIGRVGTAWKPDIGRAGTRSTGHRSGWDGVGDSHDVLRLRAAIDDPFAVDQALVMIFTVDAIPLVYYGTEQELAGGGGHEGRQPLWEAGYGESTPTFQLIRLLAALRRGSPALRRGGLVVRHLSDVGGADLTTDVEDAGLLAFERSSGDEHVLLVFNTHPTHTSSARIPTSLAGPEVIDRLGGERFVIEDGEAVVTLAPRTSAVLTAP